jgi:hypothetical protein
MKSGIFTIDIFKDLNYKGRISLAESTKNPEILTLLSEDSNQYVRGQVVQNTNTPIYILIKMLEEYDNVSWSLKTEDYYSGYRKENIEKTLKAIQKRLGKEEFKKTKRMEEILYGGKHFI